MSLLAVRTDARRTGQYGRLGQDPDLAGLMHVSPSHTAKVPQNVRTDAGPVRISDKPSYSERTVDLRAPYEEGFNEV